VAAQQFQQAEGARDLSKLNVWWGSGYPSNLTFIPNHSDAHSSEEKSMGEGEKVEFQNTLRSQLK
jgi:hypothetical protein